MAQPSPGRARRIVFGTGQRGGHRLIPEILEVGWGKFEVAEAHHLAPHYHDNAFELCIVVSGEVEWETLGETHLLRAGSLFITQVGELHWGRDSAMQPCTLYWLILDAGMADDEWLCLPPAEAHRIRLGLRSAPHRLSLSTDRCERMFATLIDEHQRQSSEKREETSSRTSARSALLLLLTEVVRAAEKTAVADDDQLIPTAVQNAMELVRSDHLGIRTSEIAAACGLKVNELNRLFLSHTGLSFKQYALRDRVRTARRGLTETPKRVTDIANELGFSSSQHFATVFRRMTGTTPSRYREMTARSANSIFGSYPRSASKPETSS
jgi:AraC-like DNA-binding protein/quercetin dioxygenase-like cupin family protein